MIALLFAFADIIKAQTVFDFEDGVIPTDWTNDNTYPWAVVVLSTGNHCVQSGNVGVSSSVSAISITKNFAEPGYITFDANCMGESYNLGPMYDICCFLIDGEEQFRHGAEVVGWRTYGFNFIAGSHMFEWRYAKDGSVNSEGDCFQVDNIAFGNGTACVAPVDVEAFTVADKALVDWSGVADSFTLRYKKSSESWTTVEGITENGYIIENLTTGDYTVEVQADCDPGNWASASFSIYIPTSSGDWYGFVSNAYNPEIEDKYVNFSMQDITAVAPATDVMGYVYGATFANGYVWLVLGNSETGNFDLCKAPVDNAHKTIGVPETVIESFDHYRMAYNPADGLIYYFDGGDNHLKSFNPEANGSVTDIGYIDTPHAFAINKDGEGYAANYYDGSGIYELRSVNLTDASTVMVGELEYYADCLAFDMETGELFGVDGIDLFYIDHATAQMKWLGEIGGDEYVSPKALFMVYDWYAVVGNSIEKFSVYPNPAQRRFMVEGKGKLVVCDVLGRQILAREIDGNAVIELSKGLYFVTLGGATQKIVVE